MILSFQYLFEVLCLSLVHTERIFASDRGSVFCKKAETVLEKIWSGRYISNVQT